MQLEGDFVVNDEEVDKFFVQNKKASEPRHRLTSKT